MGETGKKLAKVSGIMSPDEGAGRCYLPKQNRNEILFPSLIYFIASFIFISLTHVSSYS